MFKNKYIEKLRINLTYQFDQSIQSIENSESVKKNTLRKSKFNIVKNP